MLVVPAYKDWLDVPGGYIRHGETPTQTAACEVNALPGERCGHRVTPTGRR